MSSGESTLVQVAPRVWQVAAGAFVSNCYVHALATPGDCVLVDPGLDPEAIDQRLAELGLKPRAVLCTHGHFDHIGGAAWFQKKHGIAVHLPQADRSIMKSSNFLLMAMRMEQRIELPEVSPVMPDAPQVQLGGETFRYVPCPGHTPGSHIVCSSDAGFSGDSIYLRGVGLSQLPGENHAQLRTSLLGLWDVLPAGLLLCPGHGGTGSWGSIRESNMALREFLGLSQQAASA